ncbi:MAG: hypothetical protein QGG42_09775 [Phycisphaerae bacterium]|nr:hypothetical protein [Phycisphaerae bacterium]
MISRMVVLVLMAACSVIGCASADSAAISACDGKDVDIMKYASPPLLRGLKGRHVYPPPNMVNIAHDAFVRCERGGDTSYDSAEWFWNGQSVGVGRKGWKGISDKLSAMRKGAKVLFFPRQYVILNVSTSRSILIWPPWQDLDFQEIVSKRELIAIFSVRDEEGNVCPILRPQYEQWESMQGKSEPARQAVSDLD